MACERTSRRVASLAGRQMKIGRKAERSVAASALRAREKSARKRTPSRKRG